MSKYIKLTVAKTVTAELFFKVPDDFEERHISQKALLNATSEQANYPECWESDDDLEVDCIEDASADEVRKYDLELCDENELIKPSHILPSS